MSSAAEEEDTINVQRCASCGVAGDDEEAVDTLFGGQVVDDALLHVVVEHGVASHGWGGGAKSEARGHRLCQPTSSHKQRVHSNLICASAGQQ